MQLLTTDRITEDTNVLQRKIVYRGKISVLDSDSDAVVGYPTTLHTKTVTLDQFSTDNMTYDVDVACAFEQSAGYTYYIGALDTPSSGTFSVGSITSKLSSDNGKLKITFTVYGTIVLDGSDPLLSLHYIVYANQITDEDIL